MGTYNDLRDDIEKTKIIEYGKFHEIDGDLVQKFGQNQFNMKISHTFVNFTLDEFGVVKEGGLEAKVNGMSGVYHMEFVTDNEANDIARLAEIGDPIEAPTCPYKIQPEFQGKLLWITGSPGMGKSTSAQLLARNKGFVFYEGDCFSALRNPYIPVDAKNPSLAQKDQKYLSGPGLEERKKVVNDMGGVFMKHMKGEDVDFHDDENSVKLHKLFELMCEDIKKERKRVGGDWAIASAMLFDRKMRQIIRTFLGPDLIIIVLTMTEENTKKRIEKRHRGSQQAVELLMKFQRICQPAEDNEEGVINIEVDDSMSEEDVMELILSKC